MKRSAVINGIKLIGRHILYKLASPRAVRTLGEPFFCLIGMRRKGRGVALSQVNRVLVVRLDEVGDVVLTTPFLRELRRNLPQARITLVVKPAVYNLMERCPYVNQVLTYEYSLGLLRRHYRAVRLAYKHLWRHWFDLAIVPRWDADFHHATFVAYFSGARCRVGYSENVVDYKRYVNRGFDLLFTHLLCDDTLKHEVDHNLDVIRFLGGAVQDTRLEIWLNPEDEVFAKQVLESHRIHSGELLIALGPGKYDPKRRWPLLRFVELGAWLKKEYDARIVVVGGQEEQSLGQGLREKLGDSLINLVGETTLRQAGALLKQCHLYIGNDYGLKHIAAAVGVPVIEINGHPLDGLPSHPDSPRRFGSWGVPNRVIQPLKALAPCSNACNAGQAHCILTITVEQVKDAVSMWFSQNMELRYARMVS
jgi:heptosyltransferase-2